MDLNNLDQLIRACLVTEDFGLASMWSFSKWPRSGPWRPDRCALGFPLGAALQDTFRLNEQQSVRTVYILGDPTLRCYVTTPPSGLEPLVQDCAEGGKTVHLAWTASSEAEGYYVYRAPVADPENSDLVGLALEVAQAEEPVDGPVSMTQWTDDDVCPVPVGSYVYAVRAVRRISTGAGSFYALSAATFRTATITVP